MQVKLVPKVDLTNEQSDQLAVRIAAPEHQFDCGPPRVWTAAGYLPNLFAVVNIDTTRPIGAVYRAGLKHAIDVGWWIDCLYRGQGYGTKMIDEIAALLKKEGTTGIGFIKVSTHGGKYDEASRRLVSRLNSYF